MLICDNCRQEVPDMEFCVRCGTGLHVERRRGAAGGTRHEYAASPDEDVIALRVVSTVFPQLPRADMQVFRIALVIGMALIIVLAVFGYLPLALTIAAILVPTLVMIYLYDVDVYEDEPILVIGGTLLWGVVTGVLASRVGSSLVPEPLPNLGPSTSEILAWGLLLPALHIALILPGPLLLLRYHRFNDVLDGATFGSAAAAGFTGAFVLSQAWPLLSAGLQPIGDSVAWVVRLMGVGIAQPLLAVGAIGAATGAFWLRYRAPVADRNALGLWGAPLVASAGALMLLSASFLGQLLLSQVAELLWLLLLAALALMWLRVVIHLGLLQEASEIDIKPPIVCVNCGKTTSLHSFCGHCGVALRARPKQHPHQAPEQSSERG